MAKRPTSKRKVSRMLPPKEPLLSEAKSIFYCRRCQEVKREADFYAAVDLLLDQNGRMSVCSDCINSLFDIEYTMTGKDVYESILRTCRKLNVRYNRLAVDSALENQNAFINDELNEKFFGLYKIALHGYGAKGGNVHAAQGESLTFVEPTQSQMEDHKEKVKKTHSDVRAFWGNGYTPQEYKYLEREFEEWMSSHDVDSKEQELLFKYITQLQLDYERARAAGQTGTAKIIADINKTMEVAGISPGKARPTSGAAANQRFSAYIQMIEQEEPAEYYKDKELYADYDNISEYFRDFVTRPMLNYLGKTPPDFEVNDDGEGGRGGDIVSEMGESFYEDEQLDFDDEVEEDDV